MCRSEWPVSPFWEKRPSSIKAKPRRRYLRAAVSGVLREDPPTKNLYSPDRSSQSSFWSLKTERNFGSSFSVTVLGLAWLQFDLFPGDQPFRRYTCASSAPARFPVLRTVKETLSMPAFNPEDANVV